MLSRHAEAVYWLGRYMERAEAMARTIDVTYRTMLEASTVTGEHVLSWEIPLDISFQRFAFLGHLGHKLENEEQVLDFLVLDNRNPDSVLSCLETARQNAWAIRDVLSSEMVEELNKSYRWVRETRESGLLHEHPHEFLQEVKTRCHLIEGVTANTMLRDEGWHFHQVGRWLERGMQTARILEVQYAMLMEGHNGRTAADQHLWASVLKSVAAYEAYRREYLTQVRPRQVVELLVLNGAFPKGVHTATRYVVAGVQAIARETGSEHQNEADRLSRRLAAQLSTSLVDEVLIAGVPQFLADCQDQFRRIHDALSATYFTY